MPGIGDALSLVARLVPELRMLVPLLERLVSPEARREQQRALTAAAEAAAKSVESAETTKQAVVELARRTATAQAEVLARVESAEERVKALQAELRAYTEQQLALDRHMRAAVNWLRLLTVAILVVLVLLVVLRH